MFHIGTDIPYKKIRDNYHHNIDDIDDIDNDIPMMNYVNNTVSATTIDINVNDMELDKFLINIYEYYVGGGLWTILLRNFINLIILAYVIIFSTFLIGCIDYHNLFLNYNIGQSIVIYPIAYIIMFTFSPFWIWHLIYFLFQIKSLFKTHQIYIKVLQIPETDIETIQWNDVVKKVMAISKLNQYSIANIILRKDNYLMGLLNKELLKLTNSWFTKQVLTTSLTWNLSVTIFDYFFDRRNRLLNKFLSKEHREIYARQLKKRFMIFGIFNLVFSPFIIFFLLMHFVFKYGEEFYKNPGSIASREYTPLAKLLMREFNEYPHSFDRRLKGSVMKADTYIKQYPFEKITIIAHFISFISGSIAFILAVLTIIDDNILLKLEITPGRSVLFYLGVFSTIFAIARSFIPTESYVFDPKSLMSEIAVYTHYFPLHWRNKLHSHQVRNEFSAMYEYKIVIFLMEFLGVITTPFILCFTLTKCSQDIVDFFCDCSVNIDNINSQNTNNIGYVGHVCSFAAFDFNKNADSMYDSVMMSSTDKNMDKKIISKGGKMEQSFLYFKTNNPDWTPNREGQEYIDRINRSLFISNDEHLDMQINNKSKELVNNSGVKPDNFVSVLDKIYQSNIRDMDNSMNV